MRYRSIALLHLCVCQHMNKSVIWAFLHVDDTCGAESVHVCISLCVVSISCVWVMYECIWLCMFVVFSFQPIIQLSFVKSLPFYLVNN